MNNGTVKRIFCSQCGTPNDADANFCTACGNRLAKPISPAPAPVVTPPVEEAPAVVEPVKEEPKEEPVVVPVAAPEPEVPAVEEPVKEESKEEPVVVPVVVPEPEVPAVEEPVKEEPKEEPVVVPVVVPEPEVPAVEEPVKEEPKEEPIVVPVAAPEPEAPAVEEPVKEEPKEEPVVVPVAAPEPEAPAVEEPVKEEPKEEPVIVPVVVPVPEAPKAKKASKEKPVKEKPVKEKKVKEKPVKEKTKTEPAPEREKTVQNNSYYYYNNENEPAPAPAPAAPKKKKRQNFFLKILSFLLALILTAALAVSVPITLLNLFLTERNIEIIADHAVSSIELEKLKFTTADGSKNLSGVLLDITDEFDGWNHITEEQINDALLEDFVRQFVTDTLKQYGMSLREGEQMLGWTPEQIYDFIEANKETIEALAREAGYEGKLPIEEKKDMMIANIETKIGKDGISVSALLGSSDESAKIADYLNKASILFSDNTLYLAWGLVAFIVILLIFVNIGYFGSFLRACGFPAFIIGCIYFLSALAVDPVLSLVNIPNAALASVADFTVGFLTAFLMDISVIVAAVGLGMILISLIADAIRKKVANR